MLNFLKSRKFLTWLDSLYHLIFYIAKSFFTDDCYSKASALAFYSILSIVPLLAVIFGIAQGFGFEKALEVEFSENFVQQPEIYDRLIQYTHSWLQNIKGGVIAGVGTCFLLWSVISLLNSIENSLNEIWQIKKGRSYVHKLRDYLTILFVVPLFFVTASSINIYFTVEIKETTDSYTIFKTISPYILFILKFFPLVLIWTLFTFIYAFIPNTKVNIRDAAIGGIIAGSTFQIWQWFYINFQVRLSDYGVIYGSLAALPLFLIWLLFSWLILLMGAEIAAKIREGLIFLRHKQGHLTTKNAGLLVVYLCIRAFTEGETPPTSEKLKEKIGISTKDLQIILDTLSKNRIISEISIENKNNGYQPARPIEDINIQMICDAIEQIHEIPAFAIENEKLEKIERLMSKKKKKINTQE